MGTLKNLIQTIRKKPRILLSFLRALFNSWKSGKLSQESCGCASSAESISTEYRDKNFSACSANNSGHQANACKYVKIELLNMSWKAKRCVVSMAKYIWIHHVTSYLIWGEWTGQVKNVNLFYEKNASKL